MGKRAVYTGMFDPLHNGHVDVIQRSLQIFDEVIVAVGANPSKTALFTVEERLEMIDEATANLGLGATFRIVSFEGLVIDLVTRERADCIVRGIRAVSDFEYEFRHGADNRKLRPTWRRSSSCRIAVLPVHLVAAHQGSGQLRHLGGRHVPPIVEKRLSEKFPPREPALERGRR
jgi:pantetheine-phosphate adenylyltransferase